MPTLYWKRGDDPDDHNSHRFDLAANWFTDAAGLSAAGVVPWLTDSIYKTWDLRAVTGHENEQCYVNANDTANTFGRFGGTYIITGTCYLRLVCGVTIYSGNFGGPNFLLAAGFGYDGIISADQISGFGAYEWALQYGDDYEIWFSYGYIVGGTVTSPLVNLNNGKIFSGTFTCNRVDTYYTQDNDEDLGVVEGGTWIVGELHNRSIFKGTITANTIINYDTPNTKFLGIASGISVYSLFRLGFGLGQARPKFINYNPNALDVLGGGLL